MTRFFRKKIDILAVVGGLIGLIGAFKYTLFAGIIVIIIGVISKQKKSRFWSSLIFAGIMLLVLYVLNNHTIFFG